MIAEKAADVILATQMQPTEPVRPECEVLMAMTVPDLLKMSQTELDDLFTKSEAGPIPDGAGEGHGHHRARHRLQPEIAKFVNLFAWQGKTFDAEHGVLRNRISVVRPQRDCRRGLQGQELARRERSASSSTTRRRRSVAQWIRDEIRQIGPELYLGKVYWEKKRLIDFALRVRTIGQTQRD